MGREEGKNEKLHIKHKLIVLFAYFILFYYITPTVQRLFSPSALRSDNFDSYADQGTVKYFADEGGSFNAAPASDRPGMVLKQVIL